MTTFAFHAGSDSMVWVKLYANIAAHLMNKALTVDMGRWPNMVNSTYCKTHNAIGCHEHWSEGLPVLADYGIRGFIGGCYKRGFGSKFRAKAHAHSPEKIICFRSDKWIDRQELLIHEVAHVLANCGHTDKWRAMVCKLGGTIFEVPGLLRSFEKKPRAIAKAEKGA